MLEPVQTLSAEFREICGLLPALELFWHEALFCVTNRQVGCLFTS